MTKTETIASINRTLDALDEEQVRAVAEFVGDISTSSPLARALTPEELAMIERSKEDFRTGRVLTEAEYEAEMAVTMARLRAKYASVA